MPGNGGRRVIGPAKENICAVVVTFNPDPGFPERMAGIAGQVSRIVVVDNCSAPRARDMLNATCVRPDVDLILNDENLGVAAALNQGVRRAGERSLRWVLALDQDSTAEGFLVETLIDAFNHYPGKERIAVIGSNYFDEKRGKRFIKNDRADPPWIEQTTAITSGSLLSISAFERFGPFREDFFIDHVDDEYCLRALSKGFKVILCRRPVIRHPIGAAMAIPLFGKPVWTSGHSGIRRYYMIRNFVVLAREYLFTRPGWILSRAYRHAAFAVLALLLEPSRGEKLRMMVRGMRDGLAGRMGRLPA
ncbi:MAG: glycosyltransferase family 2 protein [Deltaproteobacteria bacterium]|nr:glycosyltransferase family 2 protein [Deltaproteobacteria bacterium]